MVWGGVSQRHRTELVVIAGNLNTASYREDILLPHVVPFLQAHPDMNLQHDNATSHTARSVRDFLQNRNVSVLPWPAKSPDLNPIEDVRDLLDRRVRAIPTRNVWELSGALVDEWGNISQQELANLVQSMRRCIAVLNAAGGHTRYGLFILTRLCSGTHYSITVSHMSVELLQFVSQLLNLISIQIC
uniref:Tc1-like transposase DDE domain-containing protein n=1 Tax=Oncorhynchus tshawytscha TaxID=74940 RepID=A0AAZ3QJW0_ONCTS